MDIGREGKTCIDLKWLAPLKKKITHRLVYRVARN